MGLRPIQAVAVAVVGLMPVLRILMSIPELQLIIPLVVVRIFKTLPGGQ
jgi:hypothetical protein